MDRQRAQRDADFSNKAYKDKDGHTYTQQDVDNHTSFTGTDGGTWEVYAVSGNSEDYTGFYGVAFRNTDTKEVVTSFRGTNNASDSASDIQILLQTNMPSQYGSAQSFYKTVAKQASGDGYNTPSVTGHSLGGALAQLIGAYNNVEAYTYNAPGVKAFLPLLGLQNNPYDNVHNINASGDLTSKIGTQIGNSETVSVFTYYGIPDLLLPFIAPALAGFRGIDWFLLSQHSIDNLCNTLSGVGGKSPLDILNAFIAAFDKSFNWMAHGLVGAIDAIKSLFGSAERVSSPLILDLDGDGVETTGVKAGAYFDHGGDGFAEETGWVGKDDGLLVLDRNHNGLIDSGAELFGNNTLLANSQKAANGFAALAELDANHDGLIDAQDAAFADLRVWKDANGDGYSDATELLTLTEAGVKSIATGSTASTLVDTNNNAHKQVGSFTKTDGSTAMIDDVWFDVNQTHSIATKWLDVPDDIAVLPDAKGYGQVYDLHQAMVRDQSGALKSLVSQFAAGSTAERNALVDQIIYKWARVDGIDPNSRGGLFDARKLCSLEAFMGEGFLQGNNPNANIGPTNILNIAYDQLQEFVYCQFVSQTFLKPLYDKINYTWDEPTQSLKGNLGDVATQLISAINNDGMAGKTELAEFCRSLKGMGMQVMMDSNSFEDAFSALGGEIKAIIDSNLLTPVATSGNDQIRGGIGNDIIDGLAGNDIIIGGKGNDTLYGGAGDDTFVFNLGDGQDTLWMDTGTDTLAFGPGVTLSDLQLRKSGPYDLLIKVGNGGDQVKVLSWYYPGNDIYRLDQFRFADGKVLTRDELFAEKPICGTDGNDTLSGDGIGDWLDGGAGDDVISGGAGNDIITGGQGNDTLYGGVGDDTFRFNLGDGQDTIGLDDITGTDTLAFGAGITLSDLHLVQSWNPSYGANNLVIQVGNSGDQITLTGWYHPSYAGYRLDRLSLADGTVLSLSNLLAQKPVFGTTGNDSMSGINSENDWFDGGAGNDTLNGGDGNDILNGGTGADSLNGGVGNDILTGGKDNDILYGGAGDDTFVFSLGDGQDTLWMDNGTDTLAFGAGITISDLQLVKTGSYDLVLKVGNGGDQVKVLSWYYPGNAIYRLDRFSFADGTVMTCDELLAKKPVCGTDGNDTMFGYGTDNEWFDGGAGNDTLYGYGGNDILQGGAGDDTLNGGDGNDIINGGQGNDILYGGVGDDTFQFNLGDGQDTLWMDNGTDTLAFGAGITLSDLQLVKSGSYDLLIKVGNGGDQVKVLSWYYPGNTVYRLDRFSFADGTVMTCDELLAKKPVCGTDGNDTMFGYGTDNEWFDGGAGNDTLYGYGGNDILNGGIGADTLIGGVGNDTYVVDNTGDIVTELAGEGTDTVQSSIAYTLGANVENLTLTGTAINGTGNILDNMLIGNSSANTLTGGAGNDTLNGGSGADTMIGGVGNDIYVVDNTGDVVTEAAGEGTDTVQSSINYTLGTNVENLTLTGTAINGTGNILDNVLIGNSSANTLTGWAGNDTLNGGTGADTMIGGVGNDTYVVDNTGDIVTDLAGEGTDTVQSSITYTLGANVENLTLTGSFAINGTGNTLDNVLTGNSAANTLSGGTGNDILNGGPGKDTLTGGAGNDFFVFDTALSSASNVDSLVDFAAGLDKIQLDKDIFTALQAVGTLSAASFKSSATGLAGDENDYFLYNTNSGALFYDADGSGQGVAVQFATLTTKPAVSANDFLVVA